MTNFNHYFSTYFFKNIKNIKIQKHCIFNTIRQITSYFVISNYFILFLCLYKKKGETDAVR
jgi:hypothetical protein